VGPAELFVFEGHHHSLFELFASRGLIAPTALQAAFDEHVATGRSLAALLLDRELIGKPAMLRAVAEHFGYDGTDKLPLGVPEEMLGLVGGDLARKYGIVPVAIDDHALTLLVADPFSSHLVDDLTFALGRALRFAVADPAHVWLLIKRHYSEEKKSPKVESLESPAVSAGSVEAAKRILRNWPDKRRLFNL
jgi:hypothetical protein